jgi:PAS domain S-box-containing protein
MLAPGEDVSLELEDLKAMWLELKAHVDRLAGERQQYVDFFEQSPEAYLVTDSLGRIAEVNGAAVDILQRRKHFLRGKPLTVLVAAEQRAEFRQRLRALAEGSAHRSWRATMATPEGSVETSLTARVIAGGSGICWLLQAAQ